MEFGEACEQFQSLVNHINPSSLDQFLLWAKNSIDDMLENTSSSDTCNAKVILNNIREDIRQSLPVVATTPTESIVCPTSGPNADCDPASTLHVDAFLYDEDTIDDLCDAGEMSRNYCTSCLGRSVKPLTFITHSASVAQIKYIYQYLLQDLRNKTVLDVGSRTGALLYGAYLYSEAPRIIGVELDQTFCELQKSIIQKYDMTSRIQINIDLITELQKWPNVPLFIVTKMQSMNNHEAIDSCIVIHEVIHSDVMLQAELLRNCDVIILNNVFEFFMPAEKQIQMWNFLIQTLRKPGTILITNPSIEECLTNVKLHLDLHTWLTTVDIEEKMKLATLKYFKDSEDCDLEDIHMYLVV